MMARVGMLNMVKTYNRLLKMIANSRFGVTSTEMIEKTGIPRRTVYRYLSIMTELESIYTENDGHHRRYKLLRGDE